MDKTICHLSGISFFRKPDFVARIYFQFKVRKRMSRNFNPLRANFPFFFNAFQYSLATTKMERFAKIVNSFHPLTIFAKHLILAVAAENCNRSIGTKWIN